jgi:acetolactate synthase I/II/III large subunit
VLVRTLAAQGVDVIFINPGTDTAPIQEAIAALAAMGEPVPRIVLCPHEAIALAAAHGYFAATGRVQVVLVHVDVGTQNLGSMLHNAARGEAGVVVIAGLTPTMTEGELPGGRDVGVHWLQDISDQAGVVRPYVKLTAQLQHPLIVERTLIRALQVAASQPCGPVYLTVAREVLMAPAADDAVPLAAGRHGPPHRPAADPGAIRAAARVLHESRRPVVITARSGQRPENVSVLVEVVDTLGAVVIDTIERVNFPSDHPARLPTGAAIAAALPAADAVLVVDCPVPWIPSLAAPPSSATVIVLDPDPIHVAMPSWSFPVDIGIQADPGLGLRQLRDELVRLGPRDARPAWQQLPPARPVGGAPGPAAPGLTPADLVRTLSPLLDDLDVVVEEATTNLDAFREHLHRTEPGTYFRSGGSALGWAVSAGLGVKLARPQRTVVAVVGDGSFLFSSPTAALWTLRAHEAPILIVVADNGGYAASRIPVFNLFPAGQSSADGEVVATRLSGPVDVAALARAAGAEGTSARTMPELEAALADGLATVRGGRSAVVIAHISSPWIGQADIDCTGGHR